MQQLKISDLSCIKNQEGWPNRNKTYTIEPSQHETCIYKRFDIPEKYRLDIKLNHYEMPTYYYRNNEYNTVPSLKFDYVLSVDANEGYYKTNNSNEKIELVVDVPLSCKLVATDRHDHNVATLCPIIYTEDKSICFYNGYIHSYYNKGDFKVSFTTEDLNTAKLSICGLEFDVVPDVSRIRNYSDLYDFFFNDYANLLRTKDSKVGLDILKQLFEKTDYSLNRDINPSNGAGISKALKRILPFYDDVKGNSKLNCMAFQHLIGISNKSIGNVKLSVAINSMLEPITDAVELNTLLNKITDIYLEGKYSFAETILNSIPQAKEIKKAALKRKATGAITKKMQDLDFVDIDENLYPQTRKMFFDGEYPLGILFRKESDTYFLLNDNWALWEEMIEKFPEETKELAQTASKRTTYEKDLMSYFYFILYTLPEYLERHTGKSWTCSPKLVESANELEPPTVESNGVAKTRSALTPIVDNDANHVVVPYVSMRVYGRSTQYCYALDFNILHRGMSHKGNVVSNELEVKLNGQDDYGLLYYTLTGSDSATGYPTFLVIFERLDDKSVVHFHRCHPMRSKNGEYSPIHTWIKGCYKWMIGNVPFGSIKVQQGDLAFVETKEELNFESAELVNNYDSHTFEREVPFLPYTKADKQNILGYVKLDKDTLLSHTHHKNRVIPNGIMVIRQARSWEANPRGVWSLRFD